MATKSVLVYGATGALGSVIAKQFKLLGWRTIGVDWKKGDTTDVQVIVQVFASIFLCLIVSS